MNAAGAVLLTSPDTYERHVRQQLTNLIRVGGKLAVLGVEEGARAAGWWHVCKPGSWNAPQGLNGQPGAGGNDLVHASALCGRTVVSNGYASDWRPPKGSLCPACAERL